MIVNIIVIVMMMIIIMSVEKLAVAARASAVLLSVL